MSKKQVRVDQLSYSRVAKFHYSSKKFRKILGTLVHGAGNTTVADEPSMNTCALRMSYAILWGGRRLPIINNSWLYKGKKTAYLPSLASDYPALLRGEQRIVFNPKTGRATPRIFGKKGILFFGGGFGGGVTGHLTLWNGASCHFNDGYWQQPTIWFWPLKG